MNPDCGIFVDGTACFHLSGCLYCYRFTFKHINHKILQRGDILLSWPCCAPHDLELGLTRFESHSGCEALCATLCPANIRKSVVPSPMAISSNVSWTFSDNLSMCLTSLLHRETSQCSPPSSESDSGDASRKIYLQKPPHAFHYRPNETTSAAML